MDYMAEFGKIMKTTADIALATSVEGQPNVRVVMFVWDDLKKIVYFYTFSGMPKTAEIEKNEKVAFTTIPAPGKQEHVRASSAVAKKSSKPFAEIKNMFSAKYPTFEETFGQVMEKLAVYEICFKQAEIVLGPANHMKISI
jgi:uncharacterized pyridoxamine 5'-phosphate oxidase family protein